MGPRLQRRVCVLVAGLFQHHPAFIASVCNRIIIALASLVLRLLQTPAQPTKKTPNMIAMVTHTKVLLAQFGDARLHPDIVQKAVSLGTVLEQAKQLPLVGQAGSRSRCQTGVESLDTALRSTSERAADGSLVYAQSLGDARLAPALLMQFPSTQPAAFFDSIAPPGLSGALFLPGHIKAPGS